MAPPAWAAVYTWDGGAGTDNWADGDNWDPNVAGGPVAGDDIIIDADAAISLGASRTVNSLSITGGANLAVNGGGVFSLTTAGLTINAPGTILTISVLNDRLIVTNQLNQGTNAFTLDGSGFLQVQGAGTITGTGTLTMSGNSQLYVYGNQTIYLAAVAHAATARINLANSCTLGINVGAGTADFAGIIQGAGNLRKLGAGTLSLTGLNTYTGSTRVSEGTVSALDGGADTQELPDTTDLIIDAGATCIVDYQDLASLSGPGTFTIDDQDVLIYGPGDYTFSGNMTENPVSSIGIDIPGTFTLTGIVTPDIFVLGGTTVLNGVAENQAIVMGGNLKGTGNTIGPVDVFFGYCMPGNSIGTLNVGFYFALWPDGVLVIEVNGEAADKVNVSGDVALAGALTVTGTPTKGATFTIINNGGPDPVVDGFNGLPEGAIFTSGGSQYQITYVGGDGNDVVITALDVGPEPPPEPRPAPHIDQGTSPNPTTSLGGPQLSWPQVGGSNFYRVYRADCPTCDRKQVGRVQGNSFTDASALPGQPYYYWVRTENPGGLSDYSDWMVAWRYEQNPGRAGDFNGDGIMDLLWWDPDTGRLTVWLMNGGEVQSAVTYGQGLDVGQWLLINTGDFNGNGIWDLLWWNPATGEVMAGYEPFNPRPQPRSTTQGASASIIGNISGNAEISYTGDLNGDGITDILWRDYASGQVTLWLMGADGMPQLNGPPTPADPGITEGDRPSVSGALDWQVGGLGDANGNGRADVFWKQASSNRLATWFMDGSSISGLAQEDKGLDPAWRLSGLGDLNSDRLADIVWRNANSGALQVWLMQSGLFREERNLAGGSTEAIKWQVKAVGDFCQYGCDDVYCKNMESDAKLIKSLDGEEHHPSAE